MIRSLLLPALLLGLIACNENTPSGTSAPEGYFDNPAFFDAEVTKLNSLQPGIIKTVSAEGKSEQKRIEKCDWKKELDIFSSITLNKSSYAGKYTISKSTSSGIQTIEYRTDDAKLPIKQLVVSDSSGKITSVSAHRTEHSALIDSEIRWRYVPDSGYSVHGIQKVAGVSPSVYSVSAIFGH